MKHLLLIVLILLAAPVAACEHEWKVQLINPGNRDLIVIRCQKCGLVEVPNYPAVIRKIATEKAENMEPPEMTYSIASLTAQIASMAAVLHLPLASGVVPITPGTLTIPQEDPLGVIPGTYTIHLRFADSWLSDAVATDTLSEKEKELIRKAFFDCEIKGHDWRWKREVRQVAPGMDKNGGIYAVYKQALCIVCYCQRCGKEVVLEVKE